MKPSTTVFLTTKNAIIFYSPHTMQLHSKIMVLMGIHSPNGRLKYLYGTVFIKRHSLYNFIYSSLEFAIISQNLKIVYTLTFWEFWHKFRLVNKCDVACRKGGFWIWWQFSFEHWILLEHFLSFKIIYSLNWVTRAIRCYKWKLLEVLNLYCFLYCLLPVLPISIKKNTQKHKNNLLQSLPFRRATSHMC